MLKPSLGLVPTTALVVGIIIGAAIFVQPSEVARNVSTPGAVFAAWAVAGVLTFFGALVLARLAAIYPETGGVYVYLTRTISPAAGFLWGWAMFWTMHSGIIAAVGIIVARYTAVFLPLGDAGARVLAMAVILALTAVNYIGVRRGGVAQTCLTAAKLAVIAALLLAALLFAPAVRPVAQAVAAATPGARGFLLAVAAGLYAFGGWHMASYAAGETRDAARTIPRALLAGVSIVTLCYLGLNAAYLRVLPLAAVQTSTRVAADAAVVLLGPRGAAVIAAAVVVSALGGLNGLILAGPRVYYAMARDGIVWPALAAEHARFHTPYRAIALQGAWSCVLVATGTYRALFTRVVYTEWLFFGLMALGWMRLSMRRGGRLSLPALLFAAACALLVVNQIAADWRNAAIGLGFLLSGLPVYAWLSGRRASTSAHAA